MFQFVGILEGKQDANDEETGWMHTNCRFNDRPNRQQNAIRASSGGDFHSADDGDDDDDGGDAKDTN